VENRPVDLPDGIDMSVPNVARAYDCLLGGGHNFEADRQLAAIVEQHIPYVRDMARLNRAFLRRAVLFMVESGIRQFLDLGSGIPTVGNVHEVAQGAEPSCRVMYVDKDAVAVTHSQMLLRHNANAEALQCDARDPLGILSAPELKRLLNFDEPIGLLSLLLWHFVPDSDDPHGLYAQYVDALPPGSFVALTHVTTQEPEAGGLHNVVDQVANRSKDSLNPRSYDEIVKFFSGLELVEPGVVPCPVWRPGGPGDFSEEPNLVPVYAGVARKPAA
jgi:hypothetical protein